MTAFTAYIRAIKLLLEDAVVHLDQESRDDLLTIVKLETETRLRQGRNG